MMANTSQDQKNASDKDSVNEEMCPSEKEVCAPEKKEICSSEKEEICPPEKGEIRSLEKEEIYSLEKGEICSSEKEEIYSLEKGEICSSKREEICSPENGEICSLENEEIYPEKGEICSSEKEEISSSEKEKIYSDKEDIGPTKVKEICTSKIEICASEVEEEHQSKAEEKTEPKNNFEDHDDISFNKVNKVDVNQGIRGEIEEDEEDTLDDDEEEDEGDEDEPEPEPEEEGKVEKQLDGDQDRRNPQYIPKGGAFYEHDNRTSLEDVENKDPQEGEKKKKIWKESKESERWLHDWYKESEQTPKTKAEIIQTYGYDIRKEEAPPRARRRRKYGRGPDKYERNWEDEQAYMVKQNGPGRRGKKKSLGREEFPPLPNRKSDSGIKKSSPKSQTWKKQEEEPPKNKSPKMNNQEKQPTGGQQFNRNEPPQRNNTFYSNKKTPPPGIGRIDEEDIKPFRNDKNKWKSNNFRRGKQDEIPKMNKPKPTRQEAPPRNIESNKNSSGDSNMTHLTEGFRQMTFYNMHSNMRDRQDSNKIAEQELHSPAKKLNPKRYSKNRKSFTGFFPPEDIVEIDPAEIKQLQQEQQQKNQHVNVPQQPLNIQNVIRRYPGTYNGNPGYMATRSIITGIPNQGMSPQGLQQALSPQGIPQQALSPQVPGLQTIELQQGPLAPQPNFVPPMYIDMDPHYGPSEMMGAYPGYAPYSASQPGEIYQPSGGITYYNTECQNSNQIRPPPARRQKAAIPIVPPPE